MNNRSDKGETNDSENNSLDDSDIDTLKNKSDQNVIIKARLSDQNISDSLREVEH